MSMRQFELLEKQTLTSELTYQRQVNKNYTFLRSK
jgi:hypothetical protein